MERYPTVYKFYSTYLQLVSKEYNIRKDARGEYTNFEIHMRDLNFRNFLLDRLGKTKDVVKLFADTLLPSVIKPQRLILDTPIFYVACDMMTNTYYICYKNLLMVDLDIKSEIITPEERSKTLFNFKEKVSSDEVWIIYKSRKGYHAFLVSKPIEYNSDEATILLLKCESDFYYIVYSYLRGYSVRLNKKKDEEGGLYSLIETVGNPKYADEQLLKLVNIHIEMCDTFANSGISLMK